MKNRLFYQRPFYIIIRKVDTASLICIMNVLAESYSHVEVDAGILRGCTLVRQQLFA
jgi:hypothetical protein